MKIKKIVSVAALPLMFSPTLSWALSDAETNELIATLRYMKHHAESQDKVISALENRLKYLEAQVGLGGLAEIRGRGASEGNPALSQAGAQINHGVVSQAGASGGAADTKTAQASAPAERSDAQGLQPGSVQAQAITSTQNIPLFDRKFSLEQGLTYTHYDKRSLVLNGFLALDSILLGKINLQQIKTDQLQYDLTGRMNVNDRMSVDMNVPLVYRTSSYLSPGAGGSAGAISDGSNHSSALGDISAGAYYQLTKESADSPDWVASLRLRAPTGKAPFGIKLIENADPSNNNLLVPSRQPTGNGVWSTTIGLSVLKTYDPVVMFANIGYTYNFQRHVPDLSSTQNTTAPGDVRIGNAWSLGAGFALALNERTSISFSYAQSLQLASRLRGDGGPWVRQSGSESNSATLNAGLTRQFTKNLTMVGTLSVGLTPDAPNFSFGVKFPYTF